MEVFIPTQTPDEIKYVIASFRVEMQIWRSIMVFLPEDLMR